MYRRVIPYGSKVTHFTSHKEQSEVKWSDITNQQLYSGGKANGPQLFSWLFATVADQEIAKSKIIIIVVFHLLCLCAGDTGKMFTTSSESSDDDQDSFVVVDHDPDQLKRSLSTHFTSILNSPNIQWIRSGPSKTPVVGVSPHPQRKPCSY